MNTNYFKEIAKYYQQGGTPPMDGMDEAMMQAAAADASAATATPQQAAPQQAAPQGDMDLQAMLDDPNSGVREVRSVENGEEVVLIVDINGNILGERTVIVMNNVPTEVLLSAEGEVLYVFGEVQSGGGAPQMQNGGYFQLGSVFRQGGYVGKRNLRNLKGFK